MVFLVVHFSYFLFLVILRNMIPIPPVYYFSFLTCGFCSKLISFGVLSKTWNLNGLTLSNYDTLHKSLKFYDKGEPETGERSPHIIHQQTRCLTKSLTDQLGNLPQ
jgi:hypothetical protein